MAYKIDQGYPILLWEQDKENFFKAARIYEHKHRLDLSPQAIGRLMILDAVKELLKENDD